MQQATLITAIRNRLTTDTGTGGLFNVTTPLITDVHFARANKQTTGNYIVLVVANTVQEDDMTFNGIVYQINVNIYMTSIYGKTLELSSIIDRVYALLHDWTPTLSAWSPSGPLRFISGGSTDLPDEETLTEQITFEIRQSQTRSPS